MLTKTKIYEELLTYVNSHENSEGIKKLAESGVIIYNSMLPEFHLSNLLFQLKQDIQAENNKSAGKVNLHKAMINIIRSAEKGNNEGLKGSYIQNEYQYVCDGFSSIRTKNHIELQTVREDSIQPKMKNVFIPCYDKELTLLNIPELKTHIKLETAKQKAEGIKTKYNPITYDFGEELPLVNAKYLLNILEGMPDCKAYTKDVQSSILYFEGKEAEAILLPIRRKTA